MTAQPSYIPEVKDQYEDYPYPTRLPEEEKLRLLPASLDCFDALNHYGFGGKRDFGKEFRVLVAGGGTGDALMLLAEQLRDTDNKVTYLDLSEASMNVAKERAKVRGLDNIIWKQGSLLDLPTMDLGKFDYINCSGVLHHLEDPEVGLKALESVLADDGVIGLMVYAKYGRTGVYQMQEMMRLINGGTKSSVEKLDNCKVMLENLPTTNWFRRGADLFNDVKMGDAGIYDLLLHSHDRAYSIPELYDFVESADLKLAAFRGVNFCEPDLYINDRIMLEKLSKLSLKEQYAIGELLAGHVKKHLIYLSRNPAPAPSHTDVDLIPSLPISTPSNIYSGLHELAKKEGNTFTVTAESMQIKVPKHPQMAAVFKFMDGKRSLRAIYKKASEDARVSEKQCAEAFDKFYTLMSKFQFLYLRHKDVLHYKTIEEMQGRLKA